MEVVLDWLWQGSVIAIATALALRVLPRARASARERVWRVALLLVLSVPVLQFLPRSPVSPASSALGIQAGVVPVSVATLPAGLGVLTALGWSVWASVNARRSAHAFLCLRTAKRESREFPADREARLTHWVSLRTLGRPTRLVVSERVASAGVFGLREPVIAVAPRVLHHCDDDDLDRIVVHEWAHVQRRDDLVRLVQVCASAIAGLHPAVWWINRRIDLEREIACDDRAVEITGSARAYAACLALLAGHARSAPEPGLVPAAITRSHLTARVVRLLDGDRRRSRGASVAVTILAAPALVALTLSVASLDLVGAGTPAAAVSAGPDASVAPPNASETDERRIVSSEAPAAPRSGEQVSGRSRRAPTPVGPGESGVARVVGTSAGLRADRPSPGEATRAGSSQAVRSATDRAAVTMLSPVSLKFLTGPLPAPPASASTTPERGRPTAPWTAARRAGVAVGRASKGTVATTAGVFTRLGTNVAGAF